jgi:hypothetical protein
MCRSIIQLRRPEGATVEEARAAALQYVRKVSGCRVPSRANTEVFDRAVSEIAEATTRLLDGLVVAGKRSG